MTLDVRVAAARAVSRVVDDGRSLADALPPMLDQVVEDDRSLLQELAYGVLRRRWRLQALLSRVMKKPLKARERELHALLLVGLYQLLELNLPAHAAVHETVAAVRPMRKDWARGLVNGVLRNIQRQQNRIPLWIDSDEEARHDHPAWLIRRLHRDWPDHHQEILAANNVRAGMTLRVDMSRLDRGACLDRLQQAGIPARAHPLVDSAVALATPRPVTALPGFADGEVTVQDAAAQLAAPLLDPQPGERVLDACSAPGGKTGHLLEYQPGMAELVAIDSDDTRLARVEETLTRLGRQASLVCADAASTGDWWDGQAFDRILLDAPCSATGVIRRHPDIKSLRRDSDIAALAAQQARLLDALWPLLRPGGRLLYATCSVLREENSRQIGAFLARAPDAVEHPVEARWGQALEHGRQILPGEHGMDGFFYACLEKPAPDAS